MQGPEINAVGTGLVCMLPVLLLVLATSIFWVWMLIDCISNEPSEGNDKIIWFLLIFFLYPLGALLYLFIRRPQRRRDTGR